MTPARHLRKDTGKTRWKRLAGVPEGGGMATRSWVFLASVTTAALLSIGGIVAAAIS